MPRVSSPEIVEIMGFATRTDRIRPRVHQPPQYIIIFAPTMPFALGHAKAGHSLPAWVGAAVEKSTIRRVRARPAAFDIINAQSSSSAVGDDDLSAVENWPFASCCPSRKRWLS